MNYDTIPSPSLVIILGCYVKVDKNIYLISILIHKKKIYPAHDVGCRSRVSLGESRHLSRFRQIGLGNKLKLLLHFSLKILVLEFFFVCRRTRAAAKIIWQQSVV